jgi:hypothetical protein
LLLSFLYFIYFLYFRDRLGQMVTRTVMVAESVCVAVSVALARRPWMAVSALATGAESCVSCVSKLKEAVKVIGSVGLKSQEAELEVFGIDSILPMAVVLDPLVGRHAFGYLTPR